MGMYEKEIVELRRSPARHRSQSDLGFGVY